MKLRTPGFWYSNTMRAKTIAFLLLPFSALYYLVHRLHQSRGQPYRAKIPVLCVGNLVAGGGGKTPSALALMALIREHNLACNPCFLTRGYGGTTRAPTLVDPSKHTAATIGDEPLLLSQAAPTIVSPNRAAGAQLAEQSGFDLILMDDGLQNRALARDINFLCVDAASLFGNNHLLPAGPLRQPINAGLKNIDAIILIGASSTLLPPADKPIFQATITPTATLDSGANYFAFTGLAQPAKFRRTLEALGINLTGWRTFPDHYRYTAQDLKSLQQAAGPARLLTTEKDAVRLPPEFPVTTLPIRLQWQSPKDIVAFLKRFVDQNGSQ